MDTENVETKNTNTEVTVVDRISEVDVSVDHGDVYESEEYIKFQEKRTCIKGYANRTIFEKMEGFERMDNFEKIHTLIDVSIDDEETCMKIYDLIYKYLETKKQPPPKEVYSTKRCAVCKRSCHLMQFIKNSRELKCCKSCREYQVKFRVEHSKKVTKV